MLDILKKKESNTDRQYNLDLLKTVAIICMIMCHTVTMFAEHRPNYYNEFGYIFANDIIGNYITVAHAFMFAMGVGFMYSRHNKPEDLLKRGIKTYLLAYVLNFFRYGIHVLLHMISVKQFDFMFIEWVLEQDILHFAGLAMILTALLKKLKLNEVKIFIIAIIMSIIGSFIASIETGNYFLDLLTGTFFYTYEETSYFPLFNWFIFVAFGMFFGSILRRVKNLDFFYKKLLFFSLMISTVYIILTLSFGMYFLSKDNCYSATSLLESTCLIFLDLFLLSSFYFIVKKLKPSIINIIYTMSNNLFIIYFIHWLIIGFLECVLCLYFGIIFDYLFLYLLGVIIIIVSYYLSKLYVILKNNKKIKE